MGKFRGQRSMRLQVAINMYRDAVVTNKPLQPVLQNIEMSLSPDDYEMFLAHRVVVDTEFNRQWKATTVQNN